MNAKVQSATGSMKLMVITIIPIRKNFMLFAMLGADFRIWHLADMTGTPSNVCFPGVKRTWAAMW